MLYFVAVTVLVILDQVVKVLVRSFIPLGSSIPFIPYILELTYIQNTGAAFSSLEGKTFLLGLFSGLVSAILIYVLVKNRVCHPIGRWLVALVLAGALGNMIDRLFFGYVTDMFQTIFMTFAVFNVADIFVVVGVILLAVYIGFFWERFEVPKADPVDEASAKEEP